MVVPPITHICLTDLSLQPTVLFPCLVPFLVTLFVPNHSIIFFFFKGTFIYLFIYLSVYLFIYLFILAALGLRCCVRTFSSCSERGLLFVAMCRLLIAVASLVADHRL